MEQKLQTTHTTEGTDANVSSQAATTNDDMQQHTANTLHTIAGNGDGNDGAIPPNSFNFIGRLVGETHLLLISEAKAIVGRASPGTGVDFPVAGSNLVSRHHFLIQYCCNEFTVVCLSKNGVFVGDRFLPKSGTPYKLERSCYFRFPSTDIKIFFENLIGPTPNVGLVVGTHMLPPSVSAMLYNAPVATRSPPTVSNNCEHVEHNNQYRTVDPYVENTLNQLLGPAQGSIPASGINVGAANASQEIIKSTPTDPVNSDNGKELTTEPSARDRKKPPFSYSQLIVQAISASPSQQLTLAEIYAYMKETYPYFRARPNGGWQNSIRHNLSLNQFFIKSPRTNEIAGKGNYWSIDHNIYTTRMATRYQNLKRRSATIIYSDGSSDSTFGSAPVSPNRDDNSRLAPPMAKRMAMSVPGAPEHSHDEPM